MLRSPLIHPPLLAALGRPAWRAGTDRRRQLLAQHQRVSRGGVDPSQRAAGLVTVDQVLEPVIDLVPVESVSVMRPDDGSTPEVFARYRELLGDGLPLQPLGRLEFYATCREADLACAWRPATTPLRERAADLSATSPPVTGG